MRLLHSMERLSEYEACPAEVVRKLAGSLFPSRPLKQEDLLEALMLIIAKVDRTRHRTVHTQTWSTCPCGLTSNKRQEIEEMLVLSTDKSFVNLEDLVNTELQTNNDGWDCGSLTCQYDKKEATLMSTIAHLGPKLLVVINRPKHLQRARVKVPLVMEIATYPLEDGKIAPTMVPAYLVYAVCHSTHGGNVPDAGNPESVSSKDEGHYFGVDVFAPFGCIVDCMAETPDETCSIFDWLQAREKKIVGALYSTEKPPGRPVVLYVLFCVWVGVGV